jgi:metal-dependent amidase/aminoacylase/carboxypeptidase family protein
MTLLKAQQMIEQLRAWRREFHRIPELGFEEHTSRRIGEIHHTFGIAYEPAWDGQV